MVNTLDVPVGLISALRNARRCTVLTGSGVSAESGVPTFREAQTGLWSQYDPHQLATPEAFRSNPKLVWEWYEWRRSLIATASPNPGHLALADMEAQVVGSGGAFTLVTQNVDGLHQQAGGKKVIELHGKITRTKCFDENTLVTHPPVSEHVPPRCPDCGGLLRPDVVWFGESLPIESLEHVQRAAQNCDVFLSIGTSAVIQPAATLPYLALQAGAIVVEINPVETPLSPSATYQFQYPAGKLLPILVEAFWPGDLSTV